MNRDTMEVVGKILQEDIGRDAIHIAVVAVKAAHYMDAGEHIGLKEGKATTQAAKLVGIVDPYLQEGVERNQLFLMHLYPRTITSLKHGWTHPDLPENIEVPLVVDENVGLSAAQIKAKEYLADFADQLDRSFDELILAATDYLQKGDCWRGGSSFESVSIDDTFWSNYEIYTGTRVGEGERDSFFSCSC
jgi:hypothetical protein